MAITYVGGTSGGGTGASYNVSLSGTLTGGSGSSPLEGDLIVVCSGFGNTASSAPTCSGNTSGTYQNVHAALYSNDTWDTNMRTFYQFAGATPDTTLTIGRVNNAAYGGVTVVHVWRGVNPATPIDVAADTASANNQSASRPNPPAHTPVTTGAIILACGTGMQTTAGAAFTIPSGMTNGVSDKSDGTTSDCGTFICSFAWTSGTYDPAAATGGTTSTSSSWAAATFSLRPAVDHAATGALTGPGAAIVGSAARSSPTVTHDTTGALSGQGSVIVGSAARTRVHPTSGVLTGTGSAIAGTSTRFRAFETTGALAGPGASIVGSAERTSTVVNHATTGVLSGSGSIVAGSAARLRQLTSSGALVGTSAAISGSATRTRLHEAAGVLTGPGAVITGSAARAGAPVAHVTSGALAGPGATVAGDSTRFRAFVTSGAITGSGSEISGSAARSASVVTHDATGALVGAGAVVSGDANRVTLTVTYADAQRLHQIYLLHGLKSGSPLSVSATARTAGDVVQTVSEVNGTVQIVTTAAPNEDLVDVSTMIDELSALYGVGSTLSVTATSRSSGSVSQTIASAGGTTTVTRD